MKGTLFLGGGRITSALCAGLRLADYKGRIIVYDRNPDKMRALRKESQVVAAHDLKSALKDADVLILAVRPASVNTMLQEIASCGDAKRRLCVSLAAGIPLKQLRVGLPQARWVRAMPSPVCRIGRGLTALCFDRVVKKSERSRARKFFQRVGPVVEIRESQFDVFTAAFSPSHSYHALAVLAETAQRQGLDRSTALTAAAHALCDGLLYWRDGGIKLESLLHEAATPGGTAAATISAMNKAGYQRAIAEGVKAGIAQARQNAKNSRPRIHV